MNADAETATTSQPEDREADDHAYFQAVEEIFVGLRGAPLLLSPADWQVARRWHREGVPLELVRRALEEVFARRRERGVQGRISSLRYCAHAVEAAWASWSEMMAPGLRAEAPGLDVAGRLAALALALAEALAAPSHWPAPLDPAAWRERIAALAALGRDAQRVEERLSELDRELLDSCLDVLAGGQRAELEAAVDKTLAALAGRIPAADLGSARGRLLRQILRQRLGLPLLSLFSPEAAAQVPGEEKAEGKGQKGRKRRDVEGR
jgi:hypothetical protein